MSNTVAAVVDVLYSFPLPSLFIDVTPAVDVAHCRLEQEWAREVVVLAALTSSEPHG